MAMTLDRDIRAMANRLLNTRPDASAAEALRKAAGMLIDLANERAKAQPAQAVDVDYTPGELDRTAPERIWLQIDTDGDNGQRDEPWPGADGVTWQDESIGGLEIQYVRADLATAQAVDVGAIREVIARVAADNQKSELTMGVEGLRGQCIDTAKELHQLTRALGTAQEGWISTEVSQPERNSTAIYWHKSEHGGFPAIADEWRDEHHLAYASHWLPYRSPTQATDGEDRG